MTRMIRLFKSPSAGAALLPPPVLGPLCAPDPAELRVPEPDATEDVLLAAVGAEDEALPPALVSVVPLDAEAAPAPPLLPSPSSP